MYPNRSETVVDFARSPNRYETVMYANRYETVMYANRSETVVDFARSPNRRRDRGSVSGRP
jgi:hypothetical protein